jgi:stage V sporulation protein D (sporulation-specific penicillin-binding protein)
MRSETAELLRTMLRRVVAEGTGKKAEVQGLFPAGKTGTAQKYIPEEGTYSNQRYIASFVGFAPFESPRWLCLVVLDEPRGSIWGGSVAAPVFSKIIEDVAKLDTRPAEVKSTELRWIADRHDATSTVPQVAGLAPGLARKLLKEEGFLPRLEGRGDRVMDVQPAAGSRCRPGQVVTLLLSQASDSCPELAGFPDLSGLSLRDVALRARWHGWQLDPRGSGWVVGQNPEPGSPVEAVQRLTVWLSSDSCRAFRIVSSRES